MRPKKRHQLSNPTAERTQFQQRSWVALYGCLVLVVLILARMLWLQVFSYDQYQGLSLKNQVQIRALQPTRGLIYDRNGVLLAENVPSYLLEVTPERIKRKQIDQLLQRLSLILPLSDNEKQRFKQSFARHRRGSYSAVPLKFNLSEDEVAAFVVNRHQFKGVDVKATLNRHYPKQGRTVHTVGYVGRIDEKDLLRLNEVDYHGASHTGKTGIEYFYESRLHGKVGYEQVEVNVQGRQLRVLKKVDPIPGDDLYLSIDYRLQSVAAQSFNEHAGSLVAMDPATGEVLAMVSVPDYDPNWFVNGISNERYDGLLRDYQRPLINRSVRGQYPPGSTIKQLIALAGLENGIASSQKKMRCKGFYQLPNDDHRYRDWKKRGHGSITLKHSIIQSCDVYFYDLSYRLGIDRIHDYLAQFGLGQKTQVDYPGEKAGLLPSQQWKRRVKKRAWYPGETLISGIGQGYMLATPIQLAVATATLANQGKRPQPKLLKGFKKPNQSIRHVQPEFFKSVPVNNPANWRYILNAMEGVVSHPMGTAHRLKWAKYKIAGKTGTAQVFTVKQDEEYDDTKLRKHLHDHALFVAWAPADDPEIVVAVIVENGGHGGSVAAPIAKKVMDAYLVKGK